MSTMRETQGRGGVAESDLRRSGVLLLVVLSMLTLFMLLGMTFLILASRARTTSRAFLRLSEDTTRSAESFVGLTREAALQVIRGGSSSSAVRGHDLFGDRYADPTGRFRIGAADAVGSGQLLRLRLDAAPPNNYSGLVLTLLDAPDGLSGTSMRVITSVAETGDDTNVVYVLRPPQLETVSALQRSAVLINGRDYSGGGYTPGDARSPNWSLMPDSAPNGQANEDYDAADFDNMALPGREGISFHRPELIQDAVAAANAEIGPNWYEPGNEYWPLEFEKEGTYWERMPAEVAQLRRASLRPFAFDHSPDGMVDFTGRPLLAADPVTGLLTDPLPALCARGGFGDVDSDGDGVIDSVWLDLGMAPIQLADRAVVKPLFAIKCIDLGGRLNLNVHGSPTHLADSPDVKAAGGEMSGTSYPSLRPGLGFGPLDVRLDALIGRDGLERTVYDVTQGLSPVAMSRDGIARMPFDASGRYGRVFPGRMPTAIAFGPQPRGEGLERLYRGGPPDFWSRTGVAVDHWGRPLYLPMTATGSLAEADAPYGLDLSRIRDSDPRSVSTLPQPFTIAELEALLRPYDPDNTAVLPQRLVALNQARGAGTPSMRDTCTTESWDTPGLIGELPSFLSTMSRGQFDPDLARGLRMDLNRPFGDSQDNDGDGLVDEPDERGNFDLGLEGDPEDDPPHPEAIQPQVMARLLRGLLPVDPSLPDDELSAESRAMRDQPGPAMPGLRARQLFAYQLFNLLQALPDAVSLTLASGTWTPGVTPEFTPAEVGLNVGEHATKVLAQWAVNVVDFLDSDAIMTPFRYGAGTDQIVFGCEAPDLLITETLAIHDRGIADTDAGGKIGTGDSDDNDWDQVRRPRGSLFVELYAVRSSGGPAGLPPELYRDGRLLDLGKRPGNNPGEPPVWRLAMTHLREQPRTAADGAAWPDRDVFARIARQPDSEWLAPTEHDAEVSGIQLARFAWFTSDPPVAHDDRAPTPENTYCLPSLAGAPRTTQLEPGEFLVVGPRQETPLGDDGNAKRPSKQVIELTLKEGNALVRSTNFETGDDEVARTNAPREIPLVKAETKACVLALRIRSNDWSGFNVSERLPPDYYDGPEGFYSEPRDVLFSEPYPDLLAQGTHVNAATVFLQRLADPTRSHDPVKTRADGSLNPAWNPYVTVDFQPIDLHVLNGSAIAAEEIVTEEVVAGEVVKKKETRRPDRPWHFHTRQRGLATDPAGKPLGSGLSAEKPYRNADFTFTDSDPPRPAITANPWLPGHPELINNPPGPLQGGHMMERVRNNAQSNWFPFLLNAGGDLPGSVPFHTLGFTNVSFGGRRMAPVAGSPTTPFPWIDWNDRPFASEYELLFVPRTSPGRLLTNYRNPSKDPRGTLPDLVTGAFDAFGAFERSGHLLPFTSINDVSVPGDEPRYQNADVLSRLFAYVRVASPFAGTAHRLNDVEDPYDPDEVGPVDPVAARFLPPFNFLSTFREPGRVNVNTIPREERGRGIWSGLLGLPSRDSISGAGPAWIRPLEDSSDELPPGTNVIEDLWTQSEAEGHPAILRHRINPVTVTGADGEDDTRPARAFSMLGDATPPSAATPPEEGSPAPTPWLFGPPVEAQLPADGDQYLYAERNTWHAYQPMIRAAANTTARSEVYAIWVTLGFFEVEPIPNGSSYGGRLPDGRVFQFYPDGYKLLREYRAQKGDVRRHRAFYLVDRSIPVGFEPGADNNIEKAILVESLVD